MKIIAIDPGPTESAYVVWDDEAAAPFAEFGKLSNPDLLEKLRAFRAHHCVIEQIRGYGLSVGNEVFDTCVWSGRFCEAFDAELVEWMPRRTVKSHLCANPTARDTHVREALIARLGPTGTKRAPGLLYGVSKDVWAALAVAVTWLDQHKLPENTALKSAITKASGGN